MNPIHVKMLEKANEAAIYTLYLNLADKTTPADRESLRTIVSRLESIPKAPDWSARDKYRLQVLRNAVDRHMILADSRIGNLTRSKSGLTACSFTNPKGDVFVVFHGTGDGEWIDNGEGLSGMTTVTDQQAEALNWFRTIAAENGWTKDTGITLAGHSKGGNKAQFIAIHSDLADSCFSFDGQGFSPEALTAFKKQLGAKYAVRRRNILSFAADNDYVNVLGRRLMPETQVYYFESAFGFHFLESILDHDGRFRPRCEQGALSQYAESVSKKLMSMDPSVRQYATLGIMNIFQKYLGDGVPLNGDAVSTEETIAGIGVAIGLLLHSSLNIS